MDRLVRGFIIGVIAAAIKDILNWISYTQLHFAKTTYAHLMFVLLSGRKPATIYDLIFGQFFEVMFGGAVGIMFIYYAYRTTHKNNLWFKGILFAEGIYLVVFALGTFFKMPLLFDVPTGTLVSNFSNTGVYGLSLGLGIYWWGKKTGDFVVEQKERKYNKKYWLSPTPARKIVETKEKKQKVRKIIKLK